MKHTTVALLFLALFSLVGCGGSGPTAPTPTPAPTLQPPSLVLQADAAPTGPGVLYLEPSSESAVLGQVAIRVMARSITRWSKFRGTLIFDPALLAVQDYSRGSYLEQDGAIVDYSVTSSGAGRVTFRLDRPDSLAGATGTGIVLVIRFRSLSGVRTGRSPLQWDSTNFYDSNFSDRLSQDAGGAVVIQ